MPPRARCALATCLTDGDRDDRGEPSGGVWVHGEKMSISGDGVGARDRAHRPHRPRGTPYEGAVAEVRVARLHVRGVPFALSTRLTTTAEMSAIRHAAER